MTTLTSERGPWERGCGKAPFSKNSPSALKRKADVFKFPQFEKRFRKASFSSRIYADGRPNSRNEVVFSNSCVVVRGLENRATHHV